MSAIRVVDTRALSREQWLQARSRGIGGSDAAVVAGLDPYKSPTRLWMEKTGQLPPDEAGEAAEWGLLLEPVIASEFERRTGKRVRRRNAILQHPEHSFMLANLDREIVGEDAILEIKTINAWSGRDVDESTLPDRYIIQGQHYLAVTGKSRAYYAVLIGGQRLIITHVERDDQLIARLIDIEREFWQHVLDGTPPPVDGSEDASRLLADMYPDADPDEVAVLAPDTTELIRQYHEARAAERAAADRKREAENKLKALLGPASVGRMDGQDIVTWRTVEQKRLDTQRLRAERPDIYEEYASPSSYRRFSVKEVG